MAMRSSESASREVGRLRSIFSLVTDPSARVGSSSPPDTGSLRDASQASYARAIAAMADIAIIVARFTGLPKVPEARSVDDIPPPTRSYPTDWPIAMVAGMMPPRPMARTMLRAPQRVRRTGHDKAIATTTVATKSVPCPRLRVPRRLDRGTIDAVVEATETTRNTASDARAVRSHGLFSSHVLRISFRASRPAPVEIVWTTATPRIMATMNVFGGSIGARTSGA